MLNCSCSAGAARPIPGSPLVYLGLALGGLALENQPSFDRLLQTPFFSSDVWLISEPFHKQWKLLLYTGPKIMVGAVGGVFLLVLLASVFLPGCKERLCAWRKPALLIVLSCISVPLLVSFLKVITGVYSPVDLSPYGGGEPHIGLLDQLWTFGQTAGGRSFPAGHASGGFALVSLCYLPLRPALRKWLLFAGLVSGWLMGLYQMARGEHFFSHTVTTMFISLAVITWLDGRISPSGREIEPSF